MRASSWLSGAALGHVGVQKAYLGMCRLVQHSDQAVPFLKEQLKPLPTPDKTRIEKLFADLDSDVFATREKATGHLLKVGRPALPMVEKKQAGGGSPLSNRQ